MTSITVDHNKINLSENDIEEWLFNNPNEVKAYGGNRVEKWLARQFDIPSGRIDLLGLLSNGLVVVVEVKNVEVDSTALTQVCRYAADIDRISPSAYDTLKIVIGKGGISGKIQAEADAVDVYVLSFNIEYSARISGPWSWTEEYKTKRNEMYDMLSEREFWNEVDPDPFHRLPTGNEEEQPAEETPEPVAEKSAEE